MLALPSPKPNENVDLEAYYRKRIHELTMEQLRQLPFAMNLMDAPSEQFQKDSFFMYWDAEENIQKCRNSLVTLNRKS